MWVYRETRQLATKIGSALLDIWTNGSLCDGPVPMQSVRACQYEDNGNAADNVLASPRPRSCDPFDCPQFYACLRSPPPHQCYAASPALSACARGLHSCSSAFPFLQPLLRRLLRCTQRDSLYSRRGIARAREAHLRPSLHLQTTGRVDCNSKL